MGGSNSVECGGRGDGCGGRRRSDDDAPWICGAGRKGAAQEEDIQASQTPFGALAHSTPMELVSAWLHARESGDVWVAGSLCAEDLVFESEHSVMVGRDDIVEAVFVTPAPRITVTDILTPLHVVASSGKATVVAREIRVWHEEIRQEFTVIALKGWRGAMLIARIVVCKRRPWHELDVLVGRVGRHQRGANNQRTTSGYAANYSNGGVPA